MSGTWAGGRWVAKPAAAVDAPRPREDMMDRDAPEMRPDAAADWPDRIYDLLKTHAVVVFFFPRAFTPG